MGWMFLFIVLLYYLYFGDNNNTFLVVGFLFLFILLHSKQNLSNNMKERYYFLLFLCLWVLLPLKAVTIWSGNTVFPSDWSGYQNLSASYFSTATTSHLIRVRYKDLNAGAVAILRTGDWKEMPNMKDFRSLSGNHIDIDITKNILSELHRNGCIIQGVGFTLTGVEIITKADVSKLEADVPVTNDWLWSGTQKPLITVHIKNPTGEAENVHIELMISTDKIEPYTTLIKDTVIGAKQSIRVEFGFDATPGFYQCTALVNDEVARSFILGVAPEAIVSAPDMQDDFREFWQNTKKELAAIDPQYTLTEIPSKSSAKRKVYLLEMKSLPDATGEGITRAYYAEPTGNGTYPVIVHFCGYDSANGEGIPWCMNGDDAPDYCELILSTRGQVINNRSPYKNVYGDWFAYGFGSENTYYYRGAYMDCVRAIDFVWSREKVQRENIFAEGTSQGGAFSIAAAALSDGRINAIAPSVPFMGDFPDYFKVANWPGNVAEAERKKAGMSEDEMYRMLSYFDTKNLATLITCPVYMNYSLQDNVCPPHINWAAYNNMASTEKKYQTNPTLGHATSSTWWNDYHQFFKEHLKSTNGIKEQRADDNKNAIVYNLSGMAMNASFNSLPKGIYIQNGMKFIK